MIAFTTIMNRLIIANACEIHKITYIKQGLFNIHHQKDPSIGFYTITIQAYNMIIKNQDLEYRNNMRVLIFGVTRGGIKRL